MPTFTKIVTAIVALLLLFTILSAVWITIQIFRRCRRDGLSLVMIEGHAISPASLQSIVLAFAAVVGGLWVIFSVAVTGTIDAQRFTAEKARIDSEPILAIEMDVRPLSPNVKNGESLYPIYVSVQLENKGTREIGPLEFGKIPILTIAKVDGLDPETALKGPVINIPYVKIECLVGKNCDISRWKSGSLGGDGGKGYYTFLHPGLPVGIYYVQFELPVPEKFFMKDAAFDPNKPVLWTRAQYVQVKPEK
jgi:hypothetical protein